MKESSGKQPARRTIADLRREQDMTQLELAIALGVTPGAVSGWERGINEPRSSQLRAMALLFGVSMDDIDFPVTEVPTKKAAA